MTTKILKAALAAQALFLQGSNELVTVDQLTQATARIMTEPITGVIAPLGETKSNNYRYLLTTDSGSNFFFYSKEEITETTVEEHGFGVQVMKDGKQILWY